MLVFAPRGHRSDFVTEHVTFELVYIHMCVNIYIYIYVYVYAHIYIYIYVCGIGQVCESPRRESALRVCALFVYMCMYMCICTYIYIYIYICNTCMWSRVARGKSSPTGVAVRCYSQWRWGVTCVSEDVSHETSDVTPVAPHRRCHCFEHVSREMPDVTPCHASPPQGVPRSRASRRKLSRMRSRV